MNTHPEFAIMKGHDGGLMIALHQSILDNLKRKESLEGQSIRVMEAAEKYGVTHASLSHWADKGFIRIVKRAPRVLELNEADVQLAARIFNMALQEGYNSRQAGWVLKRAMEVLAA